MFVRAESCLKTRTKLLGTEFGRGNGIQVRSKIQPQKVQVVPKIESGGFPRGRVERKRLLKASGTPQGASSPSFRRPFGNLEPFQTRQGSTSKTELNSKRVFEGFRAVSENDLECFFEVSA